MFGLKFPRPLQGHVSSWLALEFISAVATVSLSFFTCERRSLDQIISPLYFQICILKEFQVFSNESTYFGYVYVICGDGEAQGVLSFLAPWAQGELDELKLPGEGKG